MRTIFRVSAASFALTAICSTAAGQQAATKEDAGALTDNDQLRDEGKADQTIGKAKQAVDKTADTGKKVVKTVTK
jgi:uncharacterized protein YjbJ (UPF0337 family)